MSESITEVAQTSDDARARHRGPRDPGPPMADTSIPTWFKVSAGSLIPAGLAAFAPLPPAFKVPLLGVAAVMLVVGVAMAIAQQRRRPS